MDNTILRKRIKTFMSAKGSLSGISDEVILEVLKTWEQWPGTTADLYRDLGIKKGQLSSIIKKAKKLVKSGYAVESTFKEVNLETPNITPTMLNSGPIELIWEQGYVIRFGNADLLIDFLERVKNKKTPAPPALEAV